MSAWPEWSTSGWFPGALVAVCGCTVYLLPLFALNRRIRPKHYASHASAAIRYVQYFRGAPTSVLAAMSRDNLQTASHDGKELSLSKLTYDGLMYASALSFQEDTSATVDGNRTLKEAKAAAERESVPHAFMITERSQAVHAAIVERMAQLNDTTVPESMRQRYQTRVRSPAPVPHPPLPSPDQLHRFEQACLSCNKHTGYMAQPRDAIPSNGLVFAASQCPLPSHAVESACIPKRRRESHSSPRNQNNCRLSTCLRAGN